MNSGNTSHSSSSRDAMPFASEVYRTDDAREPAEIDLLRIELKNETRALRALIGRSAGTQDLGLQLSAIQSALEEMKAGAALPKKGDRVAAWLREHGIEGAAATRLALLARGSTH